LPNFLAEEWTQVSLSGEALRSWREPVAVTGRDAIAASREKPPGERAASFNFGLGDHRDFLGEGWASPEPEFTWTAANTCVLRIPKPAKAGNYRLRFTLGPYVVRGQLPSQRMSVACNGVVLGTLAVTERALVELDVPRPVMGGTDTVE